MIDIRLLLKNIRSHILIYIVTIPILTIAFLFYLNNKTEQYKSFSILQEGSIQKSAFSSSPGFSQLASIAGIESNSGDSRHTTIAIIKSRDFFKELLLDKAIQESLQIPETFNFNFDLIEFELAYQTFINTKFNIYFNAQKYFYEVSFIDNDPSLAARNLSFVIDTYNKRYRMIALQEAADSFEYLNGELDRTNSIELKKKISEISKSYMEELVMIRSKKDFPLEIVVKPNEPVFPIGSKAYALALFFIILIIIFFILEIILFLFKTYKIQSK